MEKVLLVLNDLRKGNGVASCIMQYYPSLIENGFCIDFLLLRSTDSEWESEVKKHGQVYYLPSAKYKYSIKRSSFLGKLFKNNYNIVHINVPGPEGAMVLRYAKKSGVRYRIYHSHNPINSLTIHGKVNSAIFNPLCVSRANAFLACSEDAGKSSLCGKEFTVLRNCIDTAKFSFDKVSRAQVREKLGIDESVCLYGAVGRLEHQKNPLFAMECFNTIYKKKKNASFVWVGDGSLKPLIEKYINDNNLNTVVHLVGAQEHPENWYSAMDCMILPSAFEGLGIVFIEAQASGLRCYGSTKVPADVEITNCIKRLDLNIGSLKWAEIIAEDTGIINRVPYSKEVKNAGYDISLCASALVDFYSNF